MNELVIGADIGGTKTFIALAELRLGRPHILRTLRYANGDFSDFYALLRRFREEAPKDLPVVRIVLAAAGPQQGHCLQMTNRDWRIDAARVLDFFPGAAARLANDFEAAAYGIELLRPEDLLTLQRGELEQAAPQVVIGAGTGLGVAYRIWDATHYSVIAGEGGHAGFAPGDAQQAAIWQALFAAESRVEAETLLSGPGIERLYAHFSGRMIEAAAVSRLALEEGDAQALAALDVFAHVYGAVAGDHALSLLARGGVFLAGGIAPRLRDFLQASRLLEGFNAKGKHMVLTARMPVHIVLNEQLGLLGAVELAARSVARG
jgi:glucokinase